MKIIIIGDGKVGYSLAENLSKEEHDVTIIDKNPEALKKASEYLDVMTIRGNGVSTNILLEAGVKSADLLIAATSSDEMNMVCTLTGKKLGAAHTVARIRDPEYANELSVLKADLGLDLIINPEQAAAREIARLLRFPSAIDVEPFIKGKVELAEIMTTSDMPIIGMKLMDISDKFSPDVLIGAVQRGDEIIIPFGSFEIKEHDILFIFGRPNDVYGFCKQIGKCKEKIKNVMVVGGGRIAYYLARNLKQNEMKVKIIEMNKERCLELFESLPDTLIIHGDGTDDTLLQSENLSDMDAFVSLTGRDEENLMSALIAKQHGVKKVISKITRINYPAIIKDLGIDSVVNPKIITTNYILMYVRGLKNALGNPVETVYKIIDGRAEILEFAARQNTSFLNIPLRKLKLVDGVIVAAIARKNDVIIPHGNDSIKRGDSVIIISKNKRFSDLNEIVVSVVE
jgi:trk system potassium uptake protein TrkA